MRLDELHVFLKENVLNRHNLYKCYAAVFNFNAKVWEIGFDENYLFPRTDHLNEAFDLTDKLGEEMFSLYTKQLSESYYNEIELAWFRHCEALEKFGKEVLS